MQCSWGGGGSDAIAVLSLLGQDLSLLNDVDLLPSMNQLQGLSIDGEGKATASQKLGTLPLSLLPSLAGDGGKGTTLEQELKQVR